MLIVRTLPLGGYETNCYIVGDSQRTDCVIIDPGYEAGVILDTLEDMGRTVSAVFLTHGHFDHVGAVKVLVNRFGCDVWMDRTDWMRRETELYPLANTKISGLCFYDGKDRLYEAGLDFAVHHTPGHTEGSVCFTCENALFTGDTLFAGSCGRVDLPGGSGEKMEQSLTYLRDLAPNYEIYPGHGGSSCLDAERKYNPYLKGLL